jgi:hypothetical protein
LGDNAGTVGMMYFDESKGYDVLTLMYNKADGLGLNIDYENCDAQGVTTQLIDGVCYFLFASKLQGDVPDKMIAWGDSTYEFLLRYDANISFDEVVKVAEGLKEIK